MPTIPAHAVIGLVVADTAGGSKGGWKLGAAGAVCAALPDLDVLLMRHAGVAYHEPWGHRGVTHSLVFAAGLGVAAGWLLFRRGPVPWKRAALALALATATQGLLDAMTNGGLGVAFFAPISFERFFLPWTPIPVAPLSAEAMLTGRGYAILRWELLWLVFPAIAAVALTRSSSAASGSGRG